MRNKKKLLIEQLDQKLAVFKCAESLTPTKGWINSIRTALNMTKKQLSRRIGLTEEAIKKIEKRESTGRITINKLIEIGNALDMQFVYGFYPKEGSLNELINVKAHELAKKIVLRTNQTMQLEDQGIGDEKIKESIIDLADEIKREMRRSLWD